MNLSSSSGLASKRIEFLEDDIPLSEFMGKTFQNHIYKYIKHFNRSRWKASQFR
jgi:hypothetical protein